MAEEYKFKDWCLVAYEKHQGKGQEEGDLYLNEIRKPDLVEFLNHHIDEAKKAFDAGIIDDSRWDNFQHRITGVVETLDSDDSASMAKAFYDLGRAREALDHPTGDEMLKLYKSAEATMRRELPLYRQNLARQYTKEIAQLIAMEEWTKDKKHKIRLGQMCEKVYRQIKTLNREGLNELPRDVEGLKKWLRPIAPDWAKKRGRSPKYSP